MSGDFTAAISNIDPSYGLGSSNVQLNLRSKIDEAKYRDLSEQDPLLIERVQQEFCEVDITETHL
jgi:hypothetical protein